ncbi:MAG: hypothetical protein WDZ51_00870 [Pirellulaceae bacterium]
MIQRWTLTLPASLLWLLCVAIAQGQQSEPQANVSRSAPTPWSLTPEREAAALTFVRRHHPELEQLLDQLRSMDEREFTKAVRELFRVSERLAGVRERNADLYQLQLALWKASSRVQLLAAQVRISPEDMRLRQQLRVGLQLKMKAQREVMEFDLARAKDRAQRLEEQLSRMEANQDQIIQREIRSLLPDRAAPRPANGRRPGNRRVNAEDTDPPVDGS